MDDQKRIEIVNKLLKDNHITTAERQNFIVKNGAIFDDSNFNVDICDNDDVFIHNRGAYPVVLKNYGNLI